MNSVDTFLYPSVQALWHEWGLECRTMNIIVGVMNIDMAWGPPGCVLKEGFWPSSAPHKHGVWQELCNVGHSMLSSSTGLPHYWIQWDRMGSVLTAGLVCVCVCVCVCVLCVRVCVVCVCVCCVCVCVCVLCVYMCVCVCTCACPALSVGNPIFSSEQERALTNQSGLMVLNLVCSYSNTYKYTYTHKFNNS